MSQKLKAVFFKTQTISKSREAMGCQQLVKDFKTQIPPPFPNTLQIQIKNSNIHDLI